jgi:hypothetical protein
MQIDATVGFVHSGVESHSPSSSSPIAVWMMSIPDGEVEEEVSTIIKAAHSQWGGQRAIVVGRGVVRRP